MSLIAKQWKARKEKIVAPLKYLFQSTQIIDVYADPKKPKLGTRKTQISLGSAKQVGTRQNPKYIKW